MFNRKLKLRIKELESQLSDNLRSICYLRQKEIQHGLDIAEIYFRTKHIKAPVKPSETEDSKTFEYPYKYTYSDAKKEKEIPVDVRDKIINDYDKSLKRDFMYNLTDERLRKILTNFANIYFTWDEKTTDKVVEEYLKGNLNKL
jgi:hypothetical protein